MNASAKFLCNVHRFLIGFLALGAIGGGLVLMISPNGKLMGMPLSLLDNSPFNNFLTPAIILFLVIGILPSLLIVGLIKKPESKFAEYFNFFKDMHWTWTYSIYVSFTLIMWLQIQMMFLNAVSWIHTFYMILAIAIIFTSLLPQVRDYYKK
ncbi:MAG: hypothetical protein ABIS36_04385 [Chryseolinea sp.]